MEFILIRFFDLYVLIVRLIIFNYFNYSFTLVRSKLCLNYSHHWLIDKEKKKEKNKAYKKSVHIVVIRNNN